MNKEIIKDEFSMMFECLHRIEESLKLHENKEECYKYYQPIKNMLYEAWVDLEKNGKPIFCEPDKPSFNPN